MTQASDQTQEITLQRLTFPDARVCTEEGLYAHLNEGAFLRLGVDEVAFLKGGTVWFDTYMNTLNLGNWARHCELDGLTLALEGAGRFHLHIWMATRSSFEGVLLYQDIVALDGDHRLDLSAALARPEIASGAVVMMRLTALEDGGRLTGGAYLTRTTRTERPRIAISITTFKRETEIAATAERIADFIDTHPVGGDFSLTVVDNGQTAQVIDHPGVRLIPNANLGGAGGFARGLAEAEDAGATHCLFMDDDATFQMESLARTHSFLRLARDPKAAVSGAMISNARKWAMWENGSVFDRHCRPLHVGTDLRNAVELAEMEMDAAAPKPGNFYAGWWYFAFPIAQVTRYPFPFFVRGDDISFSLANAFRPATINGVVSFQDDFPAKESPLTLYLDMRNHMAHHLSFEHMELGAWGTAKIPIRFVLRSMVKFHYEAAEAQCVAWEDIMEGPGFFAEHADMSARRASIGAITHVERWRDITGAPPVARDKQAPVLGRIFSLLLNGHLVPFWRRLGGHKAVPIEKRGLLYPVWGASRLTYLSADRTQGYEVIQDKIRFVKICWRMAKLAWRFRRLYPQLLQAYRAEYPKLAARGFWAPRFLSEDTTAETPAPSGTPGAPTAPKTTEAA